MYLPNFYAKELKKFGTRQGRKKANFFIIEGERCCREAVQWCSGIRYAVVAESRKSEDYSFPVYSLADKEFGELSMTENAQGVFFVADRPVYQEPKFSDPFILVLDRLQEPGNIGTILRTALSVGLKEVVLIKGTVDPFNPKAVRSGMGAQFRQSYTLYNSLSEAVSVFSQNDMKVWLTTPHEGTSCYDEEFALEKSALVFGEEGSGINDFTAGLKTMIPMPGEVESLNVAQAATIYLFEGVRRGIL